ncbi:MAG: redoxin family protein [Candidatus Eisenbacteria bacterium]
MDRTRPSLRLPRLRDLLLIAPLAGLSLATGPSPAFGADAQLEALKVVTGPEDPAETERRRAWQHASQDAAKSASYLITAREAAFQNPRDLDAVRHYIQVATALQRTDQLVSELEAYAESNPKRSEAHYYLGLAQTEEAAGHFERALDLDSKSYFALVGMASAEMTATPPKYEEAKSHLVQAAKLEPSEPLAFVVFEQLFKRLGDADSQVLAISKAVEADPYDVQLQQTLLRQLQAQAQAVQASGQGIETWIGDTTAILTRLAKVGPGQPELAVAAARISGASGDKEAVLANLGLAAELGFADPRGLAFDRMLASAINDNPAAKPILDKMEANRENASEDLKAHALEQLITIPTPKVETIPLLGGGTLDLASKKGKVVVLDFWATWCGPCRRALPVVQKLYERKIDDVEVYAVNVFERDGGKQVEGFWKAGGYPMPVALGTQDWATSFGVSSIPTLFLIGPDGQIRYRHQGFSPYLDQELAWIAAGLLAGD